MVFHNFFAGVNSISIAVYVKYAVICVNLCSADSEVLLLNAILGDKVIKQGTLFENVCTRSDERASQQRFSVQPRLEHAQTLN